MRKNELIGKEKFLELIRESIPKHFDDLNTKHTLFLEATLFSKLWNTFKDKYNIGIRRKDFTSLSLVINDRKVMLNDEVKNFFPFPNKSYLSYGHQHNKKGVLIDLTDAVWNEIQTDGYFTLKMEFELLPNDNVDKPFFVNLKEDEKISVTFSTLQMKIHVNNIKKGEHLSLPISISKPIGFFLLKDYEHFNQFKNSPAFPENQYIKNEAKLIPRSTDLDTFMYWTLFQDLEFSVEPYSLYDKYSNIDKTITYEAFNFANVLRSVEHDKEHEDYYKIVGIVSKDKVLFES